MAKKNNKSNSGSYYIMGRNTCLEALQSAPERVIKVLCTTSFYQQEQAKIKIKPEICDQMSLSNLLNSTSHQGVALQMSARPIISLNDFIKQTKDQNAFVIILDSLADPQNFGSILRIAECFGCKAIIYSKNRNVAVTPTVSKVAVGASEVVPMIEVSNLARAVKELKDAHWWVTASSCEASATVINDFEFPARSAIILGSEGSGVSRLLLAESDYQVFIKMFGKIDSLNVSQAAAIFAYEYSRQINKK